MSLQALWGKMWDAHDDTKNFFRLFTLKKDNVEEFAKAASPAERAKKQADGGGSPGAGDEPPKGRTRTQNIGLILGPLLFALTLLFVSPAGMSDAAIGVLASTLWVATWWITEAIPIPATALLPIILFPLTGAVEGGVASHYAGNTIFLFLGGFIIAVAMEKWNLHRRIALNIILLVGTSTQRLILGFMVATGFLSMWISNTATAMMMMPIGLAVIAHVNEAIQEEAAETNFGKGIMLGIGYSASIGGLGTLIGTPPNTIFAGIVEEMYGIDISFAKWMLFGVPLSVIIMIGVWFYLVKVAFPMQLKELPGGRGVIADERDALGKMSFEEKLVLFVFSFAAFFWITRTFLPIDFVQNYVDDTIIAITAAVMLFILPSRQAREGSLLSWNDAKNIPWGILLLFGGGLAIAAGFKESGLAQWIGEQLTILQDVNLIFVIAIVATLVLFLTEVTSNTATATMMFPIMAALAVALEVHPYALMITAGVAASSAFMLPVATPPNAIVFGSGVLKINDMVKAGFWINLAMIFIITIAIYFLLPAVWGIDLFNIPADMILD